MGVSPSDVGGMSPGWAVEGGGAAGQKWGGGGEMVPSALGPSREGVTQRGTHSLGRGGV